jgi:hypothetical protein
MPGEKLAFKTKTAEIIIDYSRCEPSLKNIADPACAFACVKACRLYGRNILKIEGNRPVLSIAEPEEIKRLDNECLGCEYGCMMQGTGCISIELPVPGLEEYREKVVKGKSI